MLGTMALKVQHAWHLPHDAEFVKHCACSCSHSMQSALRHGIDVRVLFCNYNSAATCCAGLLL